MLYDGATWNPQGATPGGAIDPRVVIFHVTAVLGKAQPHSGLDWHFHVSLDGQVDQLVDTNRRADANYKANPFAISVETEGLGSGEWTDAQLDSLLLISEWCLANHPKILRQRCPTWDGSGFGYHVMFGAPGPWTPVAKSCPGPNRIRQFDEVLLPRILDTSPVEDDLMSYLSYEEQRRLLGGVDLLLHSMGSVKENTDRLPHIHGTCDALAWGVLDPASGLRAMVAAISGDDPDVDEAALAAALAPLIPSALTKLSDADVERIAEEVANEQARRLGG